jgi:hypothetical protein
MLLTLNNIDGKVAYVNERHSVLKKLISMSGPFINHTIIDKEK